MIAVAIDTGAVIGITLVGCLLALCLVCALIGRRLDGVDRG